MPQVYVYALVDVPIALDLTGVMNEPLVLIPAAAGLVASATERTMFAQRRSEACRPTRRSCS